MTDQPPLVLASGSPRRRELLGLLGVQFTVETRPWEIPPTRWLYGYVLWAAVWFDR